MENTDNSASEAPQAMEDNAATAMATADNNRPTSVSAGTFVPGFWRAHIDQEWTAKVGDKYDDKTEDDVAGVALQSNQRLVLSPSPRQRYKKNTATISRFHKDLKTDDLDGMVVMFRAKAEQFVSVTLSPWPSLDEMSSEASSEVPPNQEEDGLPPPPTTTPPEVTAAAKSYEIVFGANNNTTTKMRSILCGSASKTGKKSRFRVKSSVTIPSRVCRGFGSESALDNNSQEDNDENWTSYWVCLSNSRLCVGMGSIPGKECFGVLEDDDEPEQMQQESGNADDTPKENDSADAEKDEKDASKTTDDQPTTFLPIRYVGIGNDASVQKKKDSIVSVKDLVVTNVPPCLEGDLKAIPSQDDLPIVCLPPFASSSSGMDVDEDAETLELKQYMEDYKKECLVRKKRAQKYGTSYREQPMKDFLPWTMAKRLQGKHHMNATTGTSATNGFVAGDIDFLDPAEISKRQARLARFANNNNEKDADNAGGDITAETDMTTATANALVPPSNDGLPIEQAWNKEAMLRPIRRDPPQYLWKESPSNADTITQTTKAPDPFSMYGDIPKAASWISDKLHISAIDWAAFKQIRNDDLVHHLEAYGPIKYIEWLGDVSCNICFANKAAASRALVCLSNELPSPPPPPKARTAPTKMQDTTDEKAEKSEEKTETADQTTDVDDTTNAAKTDDLVLPGAPYPPRIDLGCMTWRFGKRPIRKISNDRYGRKGTIARYLLRAATTEDVLVERPNSWPEPPGGFTTEHVLGPKSDYANAKSKRRKQIQRQQQQQQQNQKQQQQNRRGSKPKRKRGRGEANGNQNSSQQNKNDRKKKNTTPSNPMDRLNQGLSSSRGGFSIEEMEKERQAKKRQKTS